MDIGIMHGQGQFNLKFYPTAFGDRARPHIRKVIHNLNRPPHTLQPATFVRRVLASAKLAKQGPKQGKRAAQMHRMRDACCE